MRLDGFRIVCGISFEIKYIFLQSKYGFIGHPSQYSSSVFPVTWSSLSQKYNSPKGKCLTSPAMESAIEFSMWG